MAENKGRGPGFEERDVNVFAVGKFGVALLLMTILAMVVVVGVFRYFEAEEGGAATAIEPTKVFPEPRLERNEPADLKAYRAAQQQVLDSYGWVDAQKGIVRIPIARAMELLAQRGLPSRQTTAPESASDASVPTESGLGPKMLPPGGPLAGEGK